MSLIWGAIRAVSVEVLGVTVVLWMLFGAAGWTLESASVPADEDVVKEWRWFEPPRAIADQPDNSTGSQHRADYAAKRLDHYSQLYQQAAKRYARQVGQQLVSDLSAERTAATRVPANELLGAL